MVESFFDLTTDFYEFGWGQSFHFAPTINGASFKQAIADHELFLGEALELNPEMHVLDLGCGIGGPQRFIAERFRTTVTGLNINKYQLKRCEAYNRKAGLDDVCPLVHGDFMSIPADDQTFDAAYHIEAIAHAPDKETVYAEIFRVLKPGAIFAGYDWCVTPSFKEDDVSHRELKNRIEYGNGLPQVVSFCDIDDALRSAGFELVETRDRALDADAETPWYHPLEGNLRSFRGFPRSSFGRKVTNSILRSLELLRIAPQGATEAQEILNIAADSLIAAGRTGIFTPMYFHKARKPS